MIRNKQDWGLRTQAIHAGEVPGIIEETSYNAGLSWSPDEKRLVFMSNGGSGNYDLYLLPVLGQERLG